MEEFFNEYGYFYITEFLEVAFDLRGHAVSDYRIEVGNYFNTEEEAKKRLMEIKELLGGLIDEN